MLVWYGWLMILLHFALLVASEKKNACPTFSDYTNMETNANCWYNPDIDLPLPSVAKRYGYSMKKFRITTKDGYILTLFRIPHNGTVLNSGQPVLVQHGIGASAIFWMLQGRKSLPFVLANNGYDVWLSTSRGSGNSRKHEYLTTDDPLYWNFGLHELGTYDLPANIEFISNITGQSGNIIYIGHSMGTTISYIYSAVMRRHAESNLKAIISLSPVVYMKHIEGWHKFLVRFVEIGVNILQKFGMSSVGDSPVLSTLIHSLCGKYPGILLCEALNLAVVGIAPEQIRADSFMAFVKYFPTGISLKVLRHYVQFVLNEGRFAHYDYKFRNLAVYNETTPPLYDVTKTAVPVHLFVGTQDVLASERDVDILYTKLNSPESKTRASKYFLNFAHNDFLIGGNMNDFYNILSDVMKNKIGSK